ncbi:MAG TPA: hypothetical protein QKA14_00840 [Candidatus Megaira endosymbiont of Hartmannula sinica]|nr:hypothetical protein [Candidatus Megaera endosymbiont of Hartmannula sinica]
MSINVNRMNSDTSSSIRMKIEGDKINALEKASKSPTKSLDKIYKEGNSKSLFSYQSKLAFTDVNISKNHDAFLSIEARKENITELQDVISNVKELMSEDNINDNSVLQKMTIIKSNILPHLDSIMKAKNYNNSYIWSNSSISPIKLSTTIDNNFSEENGEKIATSSFINKAAINSFISYRLSDGRDLSIDANIGDSSVVEFIGGLHEVLSLDIEDINFDQKKQEIFNKVTDKAIKLESYINDIKFNILNIEEEITQDGELLSKSSDFYKSKIKEVVDKTPIEQQQEIANLIRMRDNYSMMSSIDMKKNSDSEKMWRRIFDSI